MIEIDGIAGPRLFTRTELFLKIAQDPGCAVAKPVNPASWNLNRPRTQSDATAERHLDAPKGRPIKAIHLLLRTGAAQARLSPQKFLPLASVHGGIAQRLYNGQHAPVHLGDDRSGRLLGRIVFDAANGPGMDQGLLAHSTGRKLDAIVFAHSLRRTDKRFLGPKIGQNSLKGQGVSVLSNLGTLAKRPDLSSVPALAQTLIVHPDVAVGRVQH